MRAYLHGPMDHAKSLKVKFRAGDLDLPERKKGYTSRKEEGKYAQMCPCGKANESRTHIVGQCEMCKEERDVLEEERRTIDECDMEKFITLGNREKRIAILGDRWWSQKAKQEGDKVSKKIFYVMEEMLGAPKCLEVSLLGVETVLRLERDVWSKFKRLRQQMSECPLVNLNLTPC